MLVCNNEEQTGRVIHTVDEYAKLQKQASQEWQKTVYGDGVVGYDADGQPVFPSSEEEILAQLRREYLEQQGGELVPVTASGVDESATARRAPNRERWSNRKFPKVMAGLATVASIGAGLLGVNHLRTHEQMQIQQTLDEAGKEAALAVISHIGSPAHGSQITIDHNGVRYSTNENVLSGGDGLRVEATVNTDTGIMYVEATDVDRGQVSDWSDGLYAAFELPDISVASPASIDDIKQLIQDDGTHVIALGADVAEKDEWTSAGLWRDAKGNYQSTDGRSAPEGAIWGITVGDKMPPDKVLSDAEEVALQARRAVSHIE